MKIYKCITTCTWNGRLWREGVITPPYHDSVTPPQHFIVCEEDSDDTEDIVDEQQPAGTFTEEELKTKKFKSLQKIAKEYGVYQETLRTNDELIRIILDVKQNV